MSYAWTVCATMAVVGVVVTSIDDDDITQVGWTMLGVSAVMAIGIGLVHLGIYLAGGYS